MKNNQIYHAKRTAIYFVTIGVIISYLTIVFMIEIGYLKQSVTQYNVLHTKLAFAFITMQLILFVWKVIINDKQELFKFENVAIVQIFIIEYLVLSNQSLLSVYELTAFPIVNALQVGKIVILLVCSVMSVIEIIEENKYKYLQINTSE